MKTLVIGGGGRESNIAWKLSQDSTVYAVMSHENPSIMHYVKRSGGSCITGNINDGKLIASYCIENKLDLAFINSDNPLEAGVVDELLRRGVPTVGPTRSGAEIEWNKSFALELMRDVLPEYTPRFWIAKESGSLNRAFDEIIADNMDIVVKPKGLTGGKGVKVMGKHLIGFEEAKQYADELIKKGSEAILVEKIEGIEFTIMAITDGNRVVYPPATYDYPYRFDNDEGPGTGGMGTFSDRTLPLPFMGDKDYEQCMYVIERVVHELKRIGRHFNGVLNAGFFLTRDGLKFMEFNSRLGDPEGINVLSVLDTSFVETLDMIRQNDLKDLKFKDQASVVKYLVTPEYAIKSGDPYSFELDVPAIKSDGIHVFFASAVGTEEQNVYETVGTSRVVALTALADTIPQAASQIDSSLRRNVSGPLQFRTDIGTFDNIEKLKQVVAGW